MAMRSATDERELTSPSSNNRLLTEAAVSYLLAGRVVTAERARARAAREGASLPVRT